MSYGVVGAGWSAGSSSVRKCSSGPPLRATVAPQAVLVEAPGAGPHVRIVEREEHFAREAVVADAGYGALDAPLVPRGAHARRIDMKVPRLRILEKRGRDPRRQRVRADDDRLRVIGNEDGEDAAEEGPRRFARLDRARGRLLEGGIHEAMARADRREDPRAKPSPRRPPAT